MTNGVAIVVATLANAYREKGHDVRVLTISGDRKAHQDGMVYYMPSFEVPLYPDLRMSLVHRHPYIKEVRNWAPDVVHIHSEASTARIGKAIAKAVGAPVVMTWHTDYAKYAFHKHHSLGVVKMVSKRLMAIMYYRSNIITVPSYKAKSILDGYGLKHPNTVIPNGIMLERFYQDITPEEKKTLLRQHGIGEDKKLLVVISRLSAEKSISELIEYLPALVEKDPQIHLMIAGSGPDEKHLHNLTEKLGMEEHITFVGFVKPEETYRYYKCSTKQKKSPLWQRRWSITPHRPLPRQSHLLSHRLSLKKRVMSNWPKRCWHHSRRRNTERPSREETLRKSPCLQRQNQSRKTQCQSRKAPNLPAIPTVTTRHLPSVPPWKTHSFWQQHRRRTSVLAENGFIKKSQC